MKHPDTESQDAKAHSAGDIAQMAGEDFDAWSAANDDLIVYVDLLARIDLYANDSEWHSPNRAF
jgi:hypothetical protein